MIITLSSPIISAQYGFSSNYIDVLELLLKKLKKNNSLTINNKLFKNDPFCGKKKKLILILENGSLFIIDEDTTVEFIFDKKKLDTKCSLNDKQILYVTTFNKKLYEEYAHKFLETFNLKDDLVIYSEDNLSFLKEKHNISNLEIVNMSTDVPELNKFIETNKERDVNDSKRGFRWATIRFCYKVFAVTHAGLKFNKNKKYDYLIWIDADCIFKKELEKNTILTKYICKNNMMSYFGRNTIYHSDCGFLIFNLNHQYISKYFESMKNIYVSNKIYKEKEWHDSYIWDLYRKKFEKKHKVINFDIGKIYSNYECSFNHIMTAIPLYNYIDHLKGHTRKKLGTSNEKKFKNYINKK